VASDSTVTVTVHTWWPLVPSGRPLVRAAMQSFARGQSQHPQFPQTPQSQFRSFVVVSRPVLAKYQYTEASFYIVYCT
jgi:hypothetical protein